MIAQWVLANLGVWQSSGIGSWCPAPLQTNALLCCLIPLEFYLAVKPAVAAQEVDEVSGSGCAWSPVSSL